MAGNEVDSIANQLAKTDFATGGGVSFEGKSLKLNTNADAEEVVKKIEECDDLTYLNMEGNTLGVEAAQAIAKALQKHPEFKRALWKDMFTGRLKEEIPKALKYLGDGLMSAGAQLFELDLSDNALGPIGVEGLAVLLKSRPCYTLQELRLNNNGLGIGGGKMLAKALLECHENCKADGKGLSLRVFIAGRNRLENDGAIALAEVFKALGTLKEIVMPQNGIYFPGVQALSAAFKHNTDLEILNLNDNTLTKHGAAAMAEALPLLHKLRVLNFGDCLLKTKGGILLAGALSDQHSQLEEVNLSSNEMKLEAGWAVVNALNGKSSLKIVDLKENSFGKKGRADIKSQMEFALVASDDEDDEDSEEEEAEVASEDDDEVVSEDGDVDNEEELRNDEDDDECEDEEDVHDEEVDEEGMEEEEEGDNDGAEEESGNSTPVRTDSPDSTSTAVSLFLEGPSAACLVSLGSDGDHVSVLRNYVETIRDEEFVEQILPLIMKVSALSVHNDVEVRHTALAASEGLYCDLFDWVERKGPCVITSVNNALLVHLGLIKCEDKKMKMLWNLEGCLVALNAVLPKQIVPRSTQELLRFFLERYRPNSRVQLPLQSKRIILETLQDTIL